jgi:hypothetical protein
VLFAAPNVPITYMLYVDAFGYKRGGIAGSFGIDAATSITAGMAMVALLVWMSKQNPAEARAASAY